MKRFFRIVKAFWHDDHSTLLITMIVGGMSGALITVIFVFLEMGLNSWGSVADWFSGIATLLAVIVSLFLSSKKEKPKITVEYSGIAALMSQNGLYYCHSWSVYNYSNMPAKITVVGALISKKKHIILNENSKHIQNIIFNQTEYFIYNKIPISVESNGTSNILIKVGGLLEQLESPEMKDESCLKFYCKDNFNQWYFSKEFTCEEIIEMSKRAVEENNKSNMKS